MRRNFIVDVDVHQASIYQAWKATPDHRPDGDLHNVLTRMCPVHSKSRHIQAPRDADHQKSIGMRKYRAPSLSMAHRACAESGRKCRSSNTDQLLKRNKEVRRARCASAFHARYTLLIQIDGDEKQRRRRWQRKDPAQYMRSCRKTSEWVPKTSTKPWHEDSSFRQRCSYLDS